VIPQTQNFYNNLLLTGIFCMEGYMKLYFRRFG